MTFFAAAHIAILISLVAVHNEHVLETLEEVNSAFIWVYVGEAAIKIIGLGFRPYLLKRTNM